jgi:hypothetical protein
MADRPTPLDTDPLLAEILEIAASLDREELRLDLSDPALVGLVDRAVAPYEHALTTPEGVAEAREKATLALAAHPDIDAILEQERARLAKQGSGVQAKRSAGRLEEVARSKRAKAGR